MGYDRKTYVEFDFAIGDRHYRIYRSPTQLLERQKGDRSKPVEHKGKADFYEIDEEGREKAHITSKGVDSAVEELLGVGVEQFRQIILLPQGDFRKLLLADSSDRQKIMEQLFQTGIYLAFEKRLQEETQKLKTEYSRGELQRTTLLETCRSESEEELEKQAETNEKILKEKETEFMQADKEQQVFLRAYDEANVLHGAFLRLETAETALKRMEEKKKEKEELRGHIKMIRAAQSVIKEWSEAVNAKKQQRTAAETLEKADADLPVKEKAKAEAEQALALFEKEKPKQKERIEMKGKLEQYRNPSRSYGTGTSVGSGEKSSGRQKKLALPKPDFHGRTSFCTGGEIDRRTALPRMRIAFSSCTCRGGRGQDNGKRCEGRGTADAPVGRRGEENPP